MHGDAGADIMFGGAGNDDYYADNVNDVVSETTVVLGPANAANTVTITDFAAEDRFGITASDYGLSQGSGLVDNGSGALVLA